MKAARFDVPIKNGHIGLRIPNICSKAHFLRKVPIYTRADPVADAATAFFLTADHFIVGLYEGDTGTQVRVEL